MLFNSYVFLLFFPVVWAAFRLAPTKARPWVLLPASLLFYGWWDVRFLGLLLLTSTVDWAVGLGLGRAEGPARRRLIALSVGLNLGVLGVFKYLGFFTRELQAALAALGLPVALPVLDLVLPVGLSFYTFQAMAYTVDVYRRELEPIRSLPRFLLFISFFPQLVAGPIERAPHLAPQLEHMPGPTRLQLAEGLQLVLWGFFKKVVVADNLASLVEVGFDTRAPNGLEVIVAAYAFTWQIYCDFSGYSDIARGLGKWLGVELMLNFDLPLWAASPQDLWRRWHISLSQWLRSYLYIPLGGNRRHPERNLLLTMLLGGLWHGANWTFLAWGAWHGLGLALHRRLRGARPDPAAGLPLWLAIPLTFHFTVLGFVLFRLHTLGQLADLGRALAAGLGPVDLGGVKLLLVLTVPVLLVEGALWGRGGALRFPVALPRAVQVPLAVASALALVLLGSTYGQEFIYFQF